MNQNPPCRIGLISDEKTLFFRFLEDCGGCCEHVTPHLLAAPFWRARFHLVIIPAGFAASRYSRLLPALRASSSRIRSYLKQGGSVLVFGPAEERGDAYDWLPFQIQARQEYGEYAVTVDTSYPAAALLEGFNLGRLPCDGFFTSFEGDVVAQCRGGPVLVTPLVGEGTVVATTIHEYPARPAIRTLCSGAKEALL